MMKIKQQQKFRSRVTGQEIKVTKIKRLFPGQHSTHDMCRVMNVNDYGTPEKLTARVIYSDSIRRKYFSVESV